MNLICGKMYQLHDVQTAYCHRVVPRLAGDRVAQLYFAFFSSRRRHTRLDCDWSSDVCSSDLESADTSTNLTPWGFWIGGEELHNNHHAFPSSARFAMRRWEFDIGWSAIRLLQALRLAKVLRVAPAMHVRPNIAVPDAETL